MTLTPYLLLTTAGGKLLDSGAPQPDPVRWDTVPFPGRPALSTASTPLFPIQAWSDGARAAVHVSAGTGTPSFEPIAINRLVDATSPTLFADLCRGTRLQFVDLVLLNTFPGDDYPNVIHEAVGLGDVLVQSIEWGASSGTDAPDESVTFAYGQIWTAYAPLDGLGEPGRFVVKGWDRVANRPL